MKATKKYLSPKVALSKVKRNKMLGFLKSLKGYRTYFLAFLIGVLAIVHYLGYIDSNTYTSVVTLLGASSIAGLRAAVE